MERETYFDRYSYQPLSSKVECVQALGKLEDAEEQGRLVMLPCKVGCTVYCIVQDESKFGIAIEKVVDVSVRGIYISDFSDNTPNDGSLIKQE